MTEHALRLHELMSHANKSRDVASPACRIILEAPAAEQGDLFHRFLLASKYEESDGNRIVIPCFSQEDTDLYHPACQELLTKWLRELQTEQDDEDRFYDALWQRIRDLSNPTLRAMMAAVCAESPLLPHIPPARLQQGRLTPEAFKEATHALDPKLTLTLLHIMNQDTTYLSEDAASLLPLLDACADQQEKVVFLSAAVLGLHEKIRMTELQKMILSIKGPDKLSRKDRDRFDP